MEQQLDASPEWSVADHRIVGPLVTRVMGGTWCGGAVARVPLPCLPPRHWGRVQPVSPWALCPWPHAALGAQSCSTAQGGPRGHAPGAWGPLTPQGVVGDTLRPYSIPIPHSCHPWVAPSALDRHVCRGN